MKCKLTRVRSVHANLRTREAEGICNNPPEVGVEFEMLADALTPGASVRMIKTSEVLEVEEDPDEKHLKFSTVNSDYTWEVIV